VARAVDGALEVSIVGSFSRLGYSIRRSLFAWQDPSGLEGKTIVVTGASSGIGRAAAIDLSRLGADVWLVGRDEERLESTRAEAAAAGGRGWLQVAAVDLTDRVALDAFARRLAAEKVALHGLVHNAGALFADFGATAEHLERTLAIHLLAPYRLTLRLAPLLRNTPGSVIVTVSSGGMYTQRFDLGRLAASAEGYNGVRAYARAKRAQVVLAHEWQRRWGGDGVASYVMHPGWVDTPGLSTGLPTFAKLGPLLRSPREGADTIVWLAADGPRRESIDEARMCRGIWLDRRRRGENHLPTTWRSAARRAADGAALWDWCAAHDEVGSLPGTFGGSMEVRTRHGLDTATPR
jgi:NAD(P)-dependent dehydrogenase (short-subunit alcohol dehydrogenase family)